MRTTIRTVKAPDPVGPYSQAVKANGFIFLAGQIPIDPKNQLVVEGGIEEQTERAILNVSGLLGASGSSLSKVVRCVVYLKSMDDFSVMNAVYARHFAARPPARTTVEVGALPGGSLIEIEATALE